MAGHVIQGLSEETASILSCLDCSTLDMTESSSTPHINYKKFIEKKKITANKRSSPISNGPCIEAPHLGIFLYPNVPTAPSAILTQGRPAEAPRLHDFKNPFQGLLPVPAGYISFPSFTNVENKTFLPYQLDNGRTQ